MKTTPPLTNSGIHICDDCSAVIFGADLFDITNLTSRLVPGKMVPSGQCPCGGLAYSVFAAGCSMIPALSVRKFADVSNLHITHKDSLLLDSWAEALIANKEVAPCLHVHEYLEGYYVYVGGGNESYISDLTDCRKLISESLMRVLILAHAQGFAYVNFDADGEIYDELKQENW